MPETIVEARLRHLRRQRRRRGGPPNDGAEIAPGAVRATVQQVEKIRQLIDALRDFAPIAAANLDEIDYTSMSSRDIEIAAESVNDVLVDEQKHALRKKLGS